MSPLWSLVNEFVETAGRVHFNHAWLLLCWCVFTGRHISSYNMVQFEYLSTCVQCSHCSCITFWHVVMPAIARGQTWLCQPLPVSTVPNTGRNLSHSNCRGLDEEEKRLIVQGYGNVTSMQFIGSYYRCYTVLMVPAILRQCFVDSLEIIYFTHWLSVLPTCVQCSHCKFTRLIIADRTLVHNRSCFAA